jgi:hypothetical protein
MFALSSNSQQPNHPSSGPAEHPPWFLLSLWRSSPLPSIVRTHQLMKVIVTTLVISSLAMPAAASVGSSPTHRLYGTWSWTYSENNCTEVYNYRPDNTTVVTSGEEVAESRFNISEKPDLNGFYRMTDVVTKSNGRTGCDAEPGGTPIGHEVTIYILFRPKSEEMLICQQPSLNTCFGPLRRVSQ